MYMTVSRISRNDLAPCTNADYETIIPSMASFAAYNQVVADMQAAGDIIYRSGSINENDELETVTLYKNQAVYTAFKADPAWAPFEAALAAFYVSPITVVEEEI